MTHEFGVALVELESDQTVTRRAGEEMRPDFEETANSFAEHIKQLEEFVTYSSAYIHGTRTVPKNPYPVKPRLRQVKRVFGKYAAERRIDVKLEVDGRPGGAAGARFPIQRPRVEPVYERTKGRDREDRGCAREDRVPSLER